MSGVGLSACCVGLFLAFQGADQQATSRAGAPTPSLEPSRADAVPQAETGRGHSGAPDRPQPSRARASDHPARSGDDAAEKRPPSFMDGLASCRGHPFSLFMLHNQLVAEDLRLSAKQKTEVESLIRAYGRDTRDKIRSINTLLVSAQRDPEGPAKNALIELSATLNERSDHYEAISLRLIDPRQRERLEQLKLQAKGILLFFDTTVSQQLALTPAQKEQIAKLHSDCERKSRDVAALVNAHKLQGNEGVKVVFGLRRQARAGALQLLTGAQREKLDKMLGPKAQFEPGELVLRENLDR
jgi:hypothetical protein